MKLAFLLAQRAWYLPVMPGTQQVSILVMSILESKVLINFCLGEILKFPHSVTKLVTFADVPQNLLGFLSIHYLIIQYPQQMVQMAFCDLSHTFQKQITNVFQHIFVILLWGILTFQHSPVQKPHLLCS